MRADGYPPAHVRPPRVESFARLDELWERYPAHRERKTFAAMEELVEEHASWQEAYEEVKEEYRDRGYGRFLVQLSWSDLPYRYETRKRIEAAGPFPKNPYVQAFLEQFAGLDTERKACFLFPESFATQFFVAAEVCRRAEVFRPVRSLFPDEEQVHVLAVFDKREMEDVLLMFHLLYTNASEEVFGGYSLYGYPLVWYQTHLWEDGLVFRSPYLPDGVARYLGNLPYCHHPGKTVEVRRNIEHLLECGYIESELAWFQALTREIMPMFQWWYQDLALYEEKDGFRTDWRLRRTRIRTELTAAGVIRPKWKHELTLFEEMRKLYPDTLYQYRPEWLGRQSLDLYVPGLRTAVEYQGIQHYRAVEFFGGEEALAQRQALDERKRALCEENSVRLIEWPYEKEPTEEMIRQTLEGAALQNGQDSGENL
ncbi:MAG: hypothetical protein IJR36_01100 [Lachnospiraceae bacterium]|nr:hypothetical protein [Lachnospiraceae bacterium]